MDLYQKHNTYLPALNGLAPLTKINGSSLSTDFKINFLQLKQLVMIGGPHDGVITPWQSRYRAYKGMCVLHFVDQALCNLIYIYYTAIIHFMMTVRKYWSISRRR